MKYFFKHFVVEGEEEVVECLARAEGPGIVGDAMHPVHPGEVFYGLTFEQLAAAHAGIIEIDESGRGRIVKS